jgi:mitochondrial chaperone BCS1
MYVADRNSVLSRADFYFQKEKRKKEQAEKEKEKTELEKKELELARIKQELEEQKKKDGVKVEDEKAKDLTAQPDEETKPALTTTEPVDDASDSESDEENVPPQLPNPSSWS